LGAKMRSKFSVCVLSILATYFLVGCGPTQKEIAYKQEIERQNIQDRSAASDVASCINKYPFIGDKYEYAVPYSQCIINGYNKYHNKPDDLYYALARKRLALSSELVDGRITYTEFQSELSNFEVQINNIRLQRQYQSLILEQNQLALKLVQCQQAQNEAAEVRYRNEINPPTTGFGNTVSALATISSSINAASACK